MKWETKIITMLFGFGVFLLILWIYKVPMADNMFGGFIGFLVMGVFFFMLDSRSKKKSKDKVNNSTDALEFALKDWKNKMKNDDITILGRGGMGAIYPAYVPSMSGEHRFYLIKFLWKNVKTIIATIECRNPPDVAWEFNPSTEVLNNPLRIIPGLVNAVPDPKIYDEKYGADPQIQFNMPGYRPFNEKDDLHKFNKKKQ